MRTFKHRKNRKTKVRKHRARKTKSKRRKARKTKRMRGGDANLAKIFNVDFGPAENTLRGLEGDVYSIEHSPTKSAPHAPGMNVGQPNNSWYTGFGWYQ